MNKKDITLVLLLSFIAFVYLTLYLLSGNIYGSLFFILLFWFLILLIKEKYPKKWKTFKKVINTSPKEQKNKKVKKITKKIYPFVVAIVFIFILLNIFSAFVYYDRVPIESEFRESTATQTIDEISHATVSDLQKIEQIIKTHHQMHVYITDIYVCVDMAAGVWNMLEAEGIDAQIIVGNLEIQNASFEDFNHAWVLTCLDDGVLAIEATSGETKYKSEHPNYYHGIPFDNPRQLNDFMKMYEDFMKIYEGAVEAAEEYEEYVERYNKATYSQRISMMSTLEAKEIVFEKKYTELLSASSKLEGYVAGMSVSDKCVY